MRSELRNILRNATRPGYLVTMAQKVALRADDYLHRADPQEGDGARVDLSHYDSDKSHFGRRSAMSYVEPRLSPGALVLMDDVQDNWFFREYVETKPAFRVFEFEGKYLGLVETQHAPRVA